MRPLLIASTTILTLGVCAGAAGGTDDQVTTALEAGRGAVEEGADADDPCAPLRALVHDLGDLPADARSLADRLGAASTAAVAAVIDLGPESRLAAGAFATLLWDLAGVYRRLAEVRPTASAAERDTVDELVDTTPAFMRMLVAVGGLSTMMPATTATCPLPDLDVSPRAMRFPGAVREFAETDLGGQPAFAVLDALAAGFDDAGERLAGGRTSDLASAYDECAGDLSATDLGDNEGCDALAAACEKDDDLACNDLYWISVPGSAYEAIGASCGGRAGLGDPRFAGFCDETGG